ncbi:S49 family peptidase [Agrobacterium tumefaciens]|uniref:S49 family peptidase n=1 Tax=Agrobacterium tumefaciens TaxID=358 RepID=UPI0015735205|nr:S49 family peptidase [Agrobacterium tumefaciens]
MNAILARFQDSTALVAETRGSWLEACAHMAADHLAEIDKSAANDNDFWFSDDDWRARYRPYNVKNGILYVPVQGVLVNNFPWTIGSWITGYEYIHQAIKRGRDDSDVKGIVLVIDSGGGMVSGNWDLVDYIYETREIKPIRAVAAEHAYSAAYNIAAATSHITVARTGGVGSVGVIITHFEYSEYLKSAGIKVNIIRSKPGKAQGNSLEPLSEEARKKWKAEVDELHKQFVAMVARGRGMDEEAVDDTDAQTFMARQAVKIGLADAIGTLDDAVTALEATFSQEGEAPMAENSQAEHEAAIAAARAEGVAEGEKTGATNALARINAILGSDAGKARPNAALNASLKTSMAADEATAFLASLPEEKTEAGSTVTQPGAGAPAGMFAAAMDGTSQPNIAAGGGDDDNKATEADKDRALIRSYGLAGFSDNKE